MLSELFKPCRVGKVELRNRLVMAPMVTFLANENGGVTQRMIDYYAARARGGVGLIILESAYVTEKDRDLGRLGVENPQLQPGLSELAEAIQEHGAKAFLQLNHRGSVLAIRKGKGPDDLTREEIEEIVEAFARASLRAQKAGFDGVEIHGANVYFITQFLSPLTNHRQDEYGRDLEGRLKFLLEILRRMRSYVGGDYPIVVRMVAHQYAPGGLTLEETRVIARRLEENGADSLHVLAGSPLTPYLHTPPMAIPRGCHVHLAAELKKEVRIPIMAVGRINDPVLADQILREGKADLIAMGRPLLADPDLPRKAEAGRLGEIRKCLACNYCRMRIVTLNRAIRCAVNAAAGRERDAAVSPGAQPKKVMVIGGGPGGMEAARVLALRGHRVTLYEKEKELGGQLNLAVIPPYKEEIRNLLDYLSRQMEALKIDVRAGCEVTREMVAREDPQAVILAAGGEFPVPEIPGLSPERIFTPAEALQAARPMGEKMLIIGGGMVACEVAEFLASRGKKVSLVVRRTEIARDVEGHTRTLLLERLDKLGVAVLTGAKILSFEGRRATLQKGEGTMTLEADGVVPALGVEPETSLLHHLRASGRTFFAVGDCVQARDIASAIHEAFWAGMGV